MLNVRNYLEDIHHVISANSPAQLKMFAYRYKADNPGLQLILHLDREALKLYLYLLKKDVLPLIKQHLNEMSEDTMH